MGYHDRIKEERLIMKDIVIIGASYLQMPLIEKAKELGYTTHVFAWQCGDIGESAADHFYPISIIEKERIADVCRKIKPAGICTISTDLGAVTANYVANTLGLKGNPPKSMIPASNKYEMRKALKDAGVKVPLFFKIKQGEALPDISALEYPAIVKPTDRSGSRGVTKICTAAELESAVKAAQEVSFEKAAIIEEYIEGTEYSCESASFNGVHHIIAFTKKYTTNAPYFIETGHIQPSGLSEQVRAEAEKIIKKSLDALNITDGISHSEFKVNAHGEIRIIEIGARMGGDCIGSHLVRLSTGVDFVKAALDISLGIEPDLEKSTKPMAAGVRFVMGRDDLDYIDRLEKTHPELIYEKRIDVDELDDAVTDSSTRHGYVVLRGSDVKEIREALELG